MLFLVTIFEMISNYLSDKATYKMFEQNCDAKVMKGIAKILEKYKNNLTKRKKNMLQVPHITQVICMVSLTLTNLN